MRPSSKAPLLISIQLTPEDYSPLAMAWKIGAPPLNFGRREGWATMSPFLKRSISLAGSMYPYAMTSPRSASTRLSTYLPHYSRLYYLVILLLIGEVHNTLFSVQKFSTQLNTFLWFTELWVTTCNLGKVLCICTREGSATFPEPKKTIRSSLVMEKRYLRLRQSMQNIYNHHSFMAVVFVGLLGKPEEIIIRLISLLFLDICVVDSLLVQFIPGYQLSKTIFIDPILFLFHLLCERMLFAHIKTMIFGDILPCFCWRLHNGKFSAFQTLRPCGIFVWNIVSQIDEKLPYVLVSLMIDRLVLIQSEWLFPFTVGYVGFSGYLSPLVYLLAKSLKATKPLPEESKQFAKFQTYQPSRTAKDSILSFNQFLETKPSLSLSNCLNKTLIQVSSCFPFTFERLSMAVVSSKGEILLVN